MSPREQILIPALMASALFMQEIDLALLNSAIPTMSRSLQVAPILLNFSVTAYMVCSTMLMPASGWIADRFGARATFQVSVGLFIAGSICCAFSADLASLIVSRVVQGVGGAFMVPVARLIVVKGATSNSIVRSMIWFTTPSVVGAIVGAPLSGYLVTYWSWSSIFWVNAPIGMVAVVLAGLYVPDYKDGSAKAFDLRGFVQVGLALGALMLGLQTIGRNVMPLPASLALAAGGVLVMTHYVGMSGSRSDEAILDFATLKARTFRIATVGGGVFVAGVGATLFMLPILLQMGLGFSALESGILLMFGTLGALGARVGARQAIAYFGFSNLMVFNSVATCAVLAVLSLFPHASALVLAILFVLAGAVRSIQYTCLNSVAYIGLAPDVITRSATLASVAQQVSFTVGVGLGATLLDLSSRVPAHAVESWGGPLTFPMMAVAAMSLLTAISFARLDVARPAFTSALRKDRPE
ncbi:MULTISPECIES: MFS transporter [unclassified Bradyrhizobium]|uniref:MFS transporter n=1 Tax=unclassified Bradyrhizobium TaxID=2631580 RepID=UPI002916146E|nr:MULTISPECIES: MFS transporter [unclassified Bradyrhizobium]